MGINSLHSMHRITYYPRAVKVAIAKDGMCIQHSNLASRLVVGVVVLATNVSTFAVTTTVARGAGFKTSTVVCRAVALFASTPTADAVRACDR